MSAPTTHNGRETSTRGTRKDPPKPSVFSVVIPESLRRPRSQPPKPPGTKRPVNRSQLLGGLAAAVILILVILLLAGGSGTTRTVPSKPANHPEELEVKLLAGITSVTAKALLIPVSGTTVQLTVNATSQYSYSAYLITPPTKTEPLISNTKGESRFIHKLTIQHLLSYHYLRIYILEPGASQARAAAQIPTSTLAEGIIAH
jgi:hypothetical protein